MSQEQPPTRGSKDLGSYITTVNYSPTEVQYAPKTIQISKEAKSTIQTLLWWDAKLFSPEGLKRLFPGIKV